MSLEILERVRDHIADAGLDVGYQQRFFRWTDQDAEGNTPLIVFRIAGDGESNILLQQTDAMVMLLENPSGAVSGDNNMAQILRLFREDGTQPGVIRFEPIGTKMGPFYLENGRPWWMLNVRVFTEDQ